MSEFNGDACRWRRVKSFGLHLIGSRLFTIFAALVIMSVNGSSYMFGLYSSDIKSALGYDQTTLNLISFFKDLGGNLGILSGLVYEFTPPWFVLLIGSVLNFVGYFMIWLSVTGRIAKPHVWQMCLYQLIGANSQSFPNTGALVTCVKNFPESRGIIVGILKGLIGLSGAIMTQIDHALHGDNTKNLILLMAWLPTVVPIVFLRAIRFIKLARQEKELKVWYKFLYNFLGLAGFIMVTIIIQNKLTFSRSGCIASASVVVLLLFIPLAVVTKEEFSIWKSKKQALNDHHQLPSPPGVAASQANPNFSTIFGFRNLFSQPKRGEDYAILQAVFSIDMLILFTATTCSMGGALAAIDNLGQISKSLGYPAHSIASFISLVSIWNFLGRVLAGFASEIFLAKHKGPRPLLLTLVILVSCVGHIFIAFGVPNSLYVSSIIIGFCLGAQLSLLVAIISEIFGLKHYSSLYNVGSVSSPVGSYIFNLRMAGRLYDKEASKQIKNLGLGPAGPGRASQGLNCVGVQCYKMAFIVISAATFFGCVVSFILVLRTKKFYQHEIYKFKDETISIDNDMEAQLGGAATDFSAADGATTNAATNTNPHSFIHTVHGSNE